MRELIHPILGTRRKWPEHSAALAVVNSPAPLSTRGDNIGFPIPQQLTQAKVDSHALNSLITPITPERARYVLYTALNGDQFSQWELFSLMEDSWDRLAKNLNEVKNAVKRLTWCVTPYSERGEEPSESAQERADLVQAAIRNWQPEPDTLEYSFEDSIYHALDAMGKGISVQEIQWQMREGAILPRAAHLITPRDYGWNREGTRLGLVTEINGGNGGLSRTNHSRWSPFTPNQFLIGQWHARSGVPGATAMLRPLVPYWIGMTFGWRWLMQTAQLFGVPFRWATYDPNTPGLVDNVSEMLEAMGSSGWAAFPAGTTLEFKEAVTSASDNPQAVIIEMAKKACDLLILGQELSSESEASGLGSGNAVLQGKVRQDVMKNAAQWAADLLNYQFVPAVLQLNFGSKEEAPVISADFSIDPDPIALANRDQILINAGMKLPAHWLYERHGVPEPEEGEAVVERQAMPDPAAGFGGGFGGGFPALGAKSTMSTAVQAKNATDQLIDHTLENLTGVSARWLGGVKPFFARLINAARDESISDTDFVATIEAAQKQFPELFAKLDHKALADALEAAMGAACVNGALTGHMARNGAAKRKKGAVEP
ncbi:MAG: hypothetical protein ABS95_01400 [Verrucomicrobia bacterium SCN 57-15]|nr:MAG: hypothetical protein ABS95_01400 [Verrucomicrobia bacterium SCN 57-15]